MRLDLFGCGQLGGQELVADVLDRVPGVTNVAM
jgi:hypothetical protein